MYPMQINMLYFHFCVNLEYLQNLFPLKIQIFFLPKISIRILYYFAQLNKFLSLAVLTEYAFPWETETFQIVFYIYLTR